MARRSREAEADFMALYLLKRAGYDTSEFGRSLRLLGDEPNDPMHISVHCSEIIPEPWIERIR